MQTFQQMLDLGDDNASRGYQQMVESYRDAKMWQKATDVAREAAQKLPNDKQLKMVLARSRPTWARAMQASRS